VQQLLLSCLLAAQVTVLDGDSKPVQQGKIGEVCLRGPNVTKGYLNRPEANEEVMRYGYTCCKLALECVRRTADRHGTLAFQPVLLTNDSQIAVASIFVECAASAGPSACMRVPTSHMPPVWPNYRGPTVSVFTFCSMFQIQYAVGI